VLAGLRICQKRKLKLWRAWRCHNVGSGILCAVEYLGVEYLGELYVLRREMIGGKNCSMSFDQRFKVAITSRSALGVIDSSH
jgi:hypothetical protein